MDNQFDLQDIDFDTAYRVARHRAAEERSAAFAAVFRDLGGAVRGLFARSGTSDAKA
ncbi:MAG: hypothetical protein AAGI13_06425 [Pseudomonadota bacterium]